jgi:iron complex outermembrane receptor protein
VFAALSASTVVGIAHADAPSTGDLKQLSVEELMDIEVTSVTRHPEKLLQAAAAIQVITQEQIRRSGATSIPEALRLADNLEVAQKNSHDWAISARGFNTALGNKLLVMIDGRTVYTPLYSGVFWDAQDYLLEDIDRIEVISGPGGTLWGANAVNGVINIITKSAADTKGVYAEAGGGDQLKEFGGARYGGTLGSNVDFRVYGKYFDRADEVFADGRRAPDAWHQERGGFRLDSQVSPQDAVSVHGDFYDGHEDVDTGGGGEAGGGNLVGRWTHVFSDESDLSLQSYYDRTHLVDPIPAVYLAGVLELAPAGFLRDDLTTLDTDFQHRFALGTRNRIVWGVGYRYTHDLVGNAPGIGFFPTVFNQSLYSAFVQDEFLLGHDLSATVGSKLEHNDYTGFEVEPNVRLEWSLATGQALWSAISRAARTPSRIDRNFAEPAPPALVILEGGSGFKSEYVTAYELGYRGGLGPLTGSVSTFYNVYSDVRSTSFTPATIVPLYFQNNLEGHTWGAELSANFQVLENWSLHAGYNLLEEYIRVKPGQFDLSNGLNETADPKHQFSLRSALNLPWRMNLDAALRWVDALRINSGSTAGTVPSYFEADTRLAWQATQGLELAVVGQNLLHAHHLEYGFPSPTTVQIERSVYGKISWRY